VLSKYDTELGAGGGHEVPDPADIEGGLYGVELPDPNDQGSAVYVRHDEQPYQMGIGEMSGAIVFLWPGPPPDSFVANDVMTAGAVGLGDAAALGPFLGRKTDDDAVSSPYGPGGFDCTPYSWTGPNAAYASYPTAQLTGAVPIVSGTHDYTVGIYSDAEGTEVVYEYTASVNYTYDPVANPVSFGWYAYEQATAQPEHQLVTSPADLTATTWDLSLTPLWGTDVPPVTNINNNNQDAVHVYQLGQIGVQSVRDADGVKTVAEKWPPGTDGDTPATLSVGPLGTGGTKTLGFYRNADGTDPFHEATITWTAAEKFEGWETNVGVNAGAYGMSLPATISLNEANAEIAPFEGPVTGASIDTNSPLVVGFPDLNGRKTSAAWRVTINYSTPYDSGIVEDSSYWVSYFVRGHIPITEVGTFTATYQLYEADPNGTGHTSGYGDYPMAQPPAVAAEWTTSFTVTP